MKYLLMLLILLSATTALAEESEVFWGYDKGFSGTDSSGKFRLKLGLKTAARLELNYSRNVEEIRGRFLIPRVRLVMKGNAWGSKNTFKLEFDLANRGNPALKDFYIERLTDTPLRFRLGQFKIPFNRQDISGDFAQALNERSLISGFSGSGRDIGLMINNGYEHSPDGVEWAAGIFNGTGDQSTQWISYCWDPTDLRTCSVSQPSNIPAVFQPMVVARAGYNYGGIKAYSELDLEGGPLRFSLSASYKLKLGYLAGEDYLEHACGVDGVLKLHGLDVTGGVFAIQRPLGDTRWGFLSQSGYMVLPKRAAVVGRFAVTPSETSEKNLVEMLGGMDFLYEAHAYKLVIDGGVLHDTHTHLNNILARAQVQLTF